MCEEIAGVFALLGGGKSYFCLEKYIWPELVNGTRTIVTNHRLKLPELRAALQAFTGRDGSEVFTRIRLLSDDDMRQFWLHRGVCPHTGGWWDAQDVKVLEKNERGEAVIFDYQADHSHAKPAGGVLYIYDEAHFGLRARDWMSFGRTGEWYFNLIRKWSDTVILVSPHPDQLDKYVRNLFQNVYMLRNGAKERFMSLFRAPKKIFWDMYLGPYENSMTHQANGAIDLQPWLAACYDTSGGAGVDGNGKADIGNHPVGLPFSAIFIGVALLVAAVVMVPRFLTGAMFYAKKSTVVHQVTNSPAAVISVPIIGSEEKHQAATALLPSPIRSVQDPAGDSPRQYFCAVLKSAGHVMIATWDGQVFEPDTLSKSGRIATCDGETWYYLPKPMRPLVQRVDSEMQAPLNLSDGASDKASGAPVVHSRGHTTLGQLKGK